jgi:hypothetical protein
MPFRDIFPLSDPTRQGELAEALRLLEEQSKRAAGVPNQKTSIRIGLKKRKQQPAKKSRLRQLVEAAAKKAR